MLPPTRITYMSKFLCAVALASLASLAAAPSILSAQTVVGHTPENSPFRDITESQRLTLFAGYFATQKDEFGATPRSGSGLGVRYDLPVAGPANFFARFERVDSHRLAFDPSVAGTDRNLGEQRLGIYLFDLGFDLDLTGRRTWHGIMPAVGFGVGIASAPGSPPKDPYDFGTQFQLSAEAGLRYIPTNSWEITVYAAPTFYQNHYPVAYYGTPLGGTPLLTTATARSGFRRNMSYTAGLSYPIFR